MPEAILKIHATPRGSKNEIIGWRDGVLCVKVTAPPVDGAANALIAKFIADSIGIRKNRVELVSGEKSREKAFRILGMTESELADKLKGK